MYQRAFLMVLRMFSLLKPCKQLSFMWSKPLSYVVTVLRCFGAPSAYQMEKDMATHCSVLAWRIPGTEEPGGLPSVGSHRVGHD